ncbi:Rpn family recombination-promoting nuclease/putative transposase [Rivularia sp. UHCC 0363]|uniref:Rpn family recombination-promoting nuclease/putative transposase n=1 Tax=Rivularia sp. UHCC 0363 TaxID=3110244 RepID=UPI003A598D27
MDWGRGYEFLEQELLQIVGEAEIGKRFVDKLVKVWKQNGEETWVLIHIEIQSQVDKEFAKRMYTYNYRIFDRYGKQVASFAVLGDTQESWRPKEYSYELWGSRASLQFPVIKLLDYEANWNQLEASENPFAVIVMAHLRTQASSQNPEARLQWKLGLIRRLYQKGYTRDKIIKLIQLLDWMMTLPKELEIACNKEIRQYEEQPMPYITTFERFGMLENQRENIIEVLEVRFGEVPADLIAQINELGDIEDMSGLKQLHKQAVTINSLEEFGQILPKSSSFLKQQP